MDFSSFFPLLGCALMGLACVALMHRSGSSSDANETAKLRSEVASLRAEIAHLRSEQSADAKAELP